MSIRQGLTGNPSLDLFRLDLTERRITSRPEQSERSPPSRCGMIRQRHASEIQQRPLMPSFQQPVQFLPLFSRRSGIAQNSCEITTGGHQFGAAGFLQGGKKSEKHAGGDEAPRRWIGQFPWQGSNPADPVRAWRATSYQHVMGIHDTSGRFQLPGSGRSNSFRVE